MSNTSPPSSQSGATDFDGLRREATKLERHLEDRVGRYQQLAQRLNTSMEDNTPHTSAHNSLLLDSAESGTLTSSCSSSASAALFSEESTLSTEIERIISSFSELNDRMARAAERSNQNKHTVVVKRYREILFDFQSDFGKVRITMNRKRETMELFNSRSHKTDLMGGDDQNSDMQNLLRERNAIENSMNSAASIIGQAGEIHSDLRNQRASLTGITGTIMNIAQTVPGLNNLVEQIRKKRNKDDWIVVGVTAGCILFTFWYVFVA
eukprot:CAMPEP_0195529976 /NCGR_PEP_ID=MMETSP0794_2-20130614/32662_1 /TAXON_ID=515487 /ORGANISM="Stephanopyxis turris, Strain CCMP 815" /LENGTH=265 /DNA_ID=CAMNT_0040661367 /DNA_START=348 /DNA_END=1145 /DNA_ORIENTATION=+